MKKINFLLALSYFVFTFTSAQSVTIGNQVWMTKNLQVDKFRNGDAIPQAKTNQEWKVANENKQAAWCYNKNDPSAGEKYGKLYNWYAVSDSRGIAPEGWHVPSDAEWIILTEYLGGKKEASSKLKSKDGWIVSGTNSSGFSGLPGGFRMENGNFGATGDFGYWWCSSVPVLIAKENQAGKAYSRSLDFFGSPLNRSLDSKSRAYSVRCIKD